MLSRPGLDDGPALPRAGDERMRALLAGRTLPVEALSLEIGLHTSSSTQS